jgi:hypothetical protein
MDDLVNRLRDQWDQTLPDICHAAADRIEALEKALLDIFDHELRASNKTFIACTAREALWPNTALAGEKADG